MNRLIPLKRFLGGFFRSPLEEAEITIIFLSLTNFSNKAPAEGLWGVSSEKP